MSIRLKCLVGIGAAVALLLSGQQVAAAQTSDHGLSSILRDCGSGAWEIGAHALYLTPLTCPYVYANVSLTVSQITAGRAQIIPCRADWGFRVFGNYQKDCIFVALSYQWFEVTTTRSAVAFLPEAVVIPGGTGSIAPSGKATGQVGIEYQNVNVKIGKQAQWWCGSTLYLYGNARWVDLSHRRTTGAVYANGFVEDVREKSQLEGGAIGVGLGGECDIWCGVGAFVDGSVLGVIGNRSTTGVRYRQVSQVGTLTLREESYPSEVCVIPEVDFRIGLNYIYECGCWKLVGEVGYEVDYFWHGSTFPEVVGVRLVSQSGGRNFPFLCEDLGFSGLFFGGRFIF